MKRLIVIGDLHYGALQSRFRQWVEYTEYPLRYIMTYCQDKGIKQVVFTGDIFDTHSPSQDLIIRFASFLKKYPSINFHLYLGNHDIYDENTNSLRLIGYFMQDTNVFVYHQRTSTIIYGKKITFAPWPIDKTEPDSYITFAHIPVKGSQMANGRKFHNAAKVKHSYWIIGDLHNYQKGKNWIFPGALHQHRANDDPQRYFLEVLFADKPKVITHKLPIHYSLYP